MSLRTVPGRDEKTTAALCANAHGFSLHAGGVAVVRISARNSNGAELKELTGTTPDGDTAAGVMDEVIRNPTSQLTPADLAALMASLRSLPPPPDEPRD